jgi:hypothetical protein
LDALLKTPFQLKGLISHVDYIIISLDNPSLNEIRSEWEKELVGEISDEVWNHALLRVNGSSSCARSAL